MSGWIGDFRTGKTVRKMWNSNAVAGESITLATNGTMSAYKDGGTTQSTTGITATEDFDSLTGVHLVAIDTSADGTFYSAGSDFEVVLSGATIDGKSINATLFSFSLENRSALMPTTDGRKLDVSAGGEAGVDWANVGSPTTTVGLSGTTVKTATDVETDTADIQSRLPAALVSGRIDASVGAMAANTITATAIAADAITDAKVASDVTIASVTGAVGSVTGAVGSVTGNVGGNVTGTIGGLTAAALKDFFDTDSATTYASAVAGSVVKEIADNAGGSSLTASDIADEVQTRTIAAVTTVNGLAANTVTAAALAADAGTEIGTAVWATTTRLLTAGTNIALAKGIGVTGFNDLDAAGVRSAVGLASANLDTQLDALPTNAELATALGTADDAVLAQVALVKAVTDKLDDTVEDDGGTYRFTTNALEQAPSGTGASAATIADAVWDEAIADHVAAGSFGLGIDAVPTAIENADALLDRSNGIETGWTFRQASRIVLAVLGGKASGMATTTAIFRDVGDTKNRVTATVDASGNRTAVTLDGA